MISQHSSQTDVCCCWANPLDSQTDWSVNEDTLSRRNAYESIKLPLSLIICYYNSLSLALPLSLLLSLLPIMLHLELQWLVVGGTPKAVITPRTSCASQAHYQTSSHLPVLVMGSTSQIGQTRSHQHSSPTDVFAAGRYLATRFLERSCDGIYTIP